MKSLKFWGKLQREYCFDRFFTMGKIKKTTKARSKTSEAGRAGRLRKRGGFERRQKFWTRDACGDGDNLVCFFFFFSCFFAKFLFLAITTKQYSPNATYTTTIQINTNKPNITYYKHVHVTVITNTSILCYGEPAERKRKHNKANTSFLNKRLKKQVL